MSLSRTCSVGLCALAAWIAAFWLAGMERGGEDAYHVRSLAEYRNGTGA